MINGTNVFPEDNPSWGSINLHATWPWSIPTEPAGAVPAGATAGPRPAAAIAASLDSATAGPGLAAAAAVSLAAASAASLGGATATSVAGWLACIVGRMGARLFRMNDAEARWRGWEIVELRGGMARRYRDRRFATLRAPGATTLRPWNPQSPCEPRPPAAEPPGVHEDRGDCS
jgi:hypothetical protein